MTLRTVPNDRLIDGEKLDFISVTQGVDLDTIESDLSGKQDTLVSGTNIKTINSQSLLGSGDIAIGGTGTVTDVSVVSANGLAGTVATSATTPAITLSTTVTGLLKGNGTSISAAVSGTDYETAGAAATAETNAKAYADGLVVGLLDDRGSYDASVNTFPASGGSGTAGAILK